MRLKKPHIDVGLFTNREPGIRLSMGLLGMPRLAAC